MEDMERLRKKLDDNRISLNEDVRRTELNEDKMRKDARSKERLARKDDDSKILSPDARNGRQTESAAGHVPGETGRGEKGHGGAGSRG